VGFLYRQCDGACETICRIVEQPVDLNRVAVALCQRGESHSSIAECGLMNGDAIDAHPDSFGIGPDGSMNIDLKVDCAARNISASKEQASGGRG
jgi:hypothetical protein